MSDTQDYIIALCTCPDRESAGRIADRLVEANYAACVNIIPGLLSVYQWQQKLEHADELLLLIKTRRDRYEDMEGLIQELHPYELPEIITVSIERGLDGYLAWIDQSVGK